eukprot:1187163-Prorocentrum_minimum.AAC.5
MLDTQEYHHIMTEQSSNRQGLNAEDIADSDFDSEAGSRPGSREDAEKTKKPGKDKKPHLEKGGILDSFKEADFDDFDDDDDDAKIDASGPKRGGTRPNVSSLIRTRTSKSLSPPGTLSFPLDPI